MASYSDVLDEHCQVSWPTILFYRNDLTRGLIGQIYSHETAIASSIHRSIRDRNRQVKKRNTEKEKHVKFTQDEKSNKRAKDCVDLCRSKVQGRCWREIK